MEDKIFVIWETYDDGDIYEREMCYEGIRAEEGAFRNYDDALKRVKELIEWRKLHTHALPGEQISVGVEIKEKDDDTDVYFVENEMDYWTYSVMEMQLR